MTRRGDNWARGARTRARACQYYRIIARIIHKSSWCQNWVRRIGLRCKKSPKDLPSPVTVCLFGDAVTDKTGSVCGGCGEESRSASVTIERWRSESLKRSLSDQAKVIYKNSSRYFSSLISFFFSSRIIYRVVHQKNTPNIISVH